MIHKYVLPLVAVAALGLAVFYVVSSRKSGPEAPPYKEPTDKPAGAVLAGSGIVEPVAQNIAVAAPLPGIVVEVIPLDRLGKPVSAGELLFRLDDRQPLAELALRKAMLASAEAQLERLVKMPREEEIAPLEAKIAEAEANVKDQQDQLTRAKRLRDKGAMSTEDLERRQYALETCRAQLDKARADFRLLKAGSWKPDLAVSRAAVAQASAQVKQVEIEIERLVVRAPSKAVLLQVNVRPGEFVGAPPGQTVILLGNLDDLHVRVDIDEHDAPRFRPGTPARGYLRGHPDHEYELEFVRREPYILPKKSLTGDNTERVDTRVLQVIYRFRKKPDAEHEVYVGQQLDVFIGQPQ